MTTITGIDVSFWQDSNATPARIDWSKAAAAGAKFAFIRAGQNTWADEDFHYNWRESRRAGIPRGAYWYLDNRSDPRAQAERFYNLVANTQNLGELPLVIDFEMRAEAPTPLIARSRLKIALNTLEQLDQRIAILYTAPAYWAEFGSSDETWNRYPLWLAHYNRTSPTVPAPWPTWTFWQYTTAGDGLKYGMELRCLDMDYYNPGQVFDDAILRPGAPSLVLTDSDKLALLWAAHPDLHPRTTHTAN